MFVEKLFLAFAAIFINVLGQVLLKAGLGYKVNGEQIVPNWAKALGAKPLEINLAKFTPQDFVTLITNIPAVVGSLMGLVFFAVWISLISKAGLSFANGMMTLFLVIISIISFFLFDEKFNLIKVIGLTLIVIGFISLAIGEARIK